MSPLFMGGKIERTSRQDCGGCTHKCFEKRDEVCRPAAGQGASAWDEAFQLRATKNPAASCEAPGALFEPVFLNQM
jgi:hypothetical protein